MDPALSWWTGFLPLLFSTLRRIPTGLYVTPAAPTLESGRLASLMMILALGEQYPGDFSLSGVSPCAADWTQLSFGDSARGSMPSCVGLGTLNPWSMTLPNHLPALGLGGKQFSIYQCKVGLPEIEVFGYRPPGLDDDGLLDDSGCLDDGRLDGQRGLGRNHGSDSTSGGRYAGVFCSMLLVMVLHYVLQLIPCGYLFTTRDGSLGGVFAYVADWLQLSSRVSMTLPKHLPALGLGGKMLSIYQRLWDSTLTVF